MPTTPATATLASAIQTIMQSATVNGSAAYNNVVIGGLKDYTDAMPVGAIIITDGSSDRYVLGRSAKIHDRPRFSIASVVPYTNAEQAELQLYAIRDAVTFLFQQSATLNTPGVIISNVLKDSEHWSFETINGNKMRVHVFDLEITYEYTLPIGPQP